MSDNCFTRLVSWRQNKQRDSVSLFLHEEKRVPEKSDKDEPPTKPTTWAWSAELIRIPCSIFDADMETNPRVHGDKRIQRQQQITAGSQRQLMCQRGTAAYCVKASESYQSRILVWRLLLNETEYNNMSSLSPFSNPVFIQRPIWKRLRHGLGHFGRNGMKMIWISKVSSFVSCVEVSMRLILEQIKRIYQNVNLLLAYILIHFCCCFLSVRSVWNN